VARPNFEKGQNEYCELGNEDVFFPDIAKDKYIKKEWLWKHETRENQKLHNDIKHIIAVSNGVHRF
jgi:hypothetical protein